MADNRAITPPSLLGIDRRIAYANKKYHSGLMCGGVTMGFAGIKLSGSPSTLGLNRASKINVISTAASPRRSLSEKYGWNGILSVPGSSPAGLLDPVSCRSRMCITAAPVTTKGSRK